MQKIKLVSKEAIRYPSPEFNKINKIASPSSKIKSSRSTAFFYLRSISINFIVKAENYKPRERTVEELKICDGIQRTC